MKIGDWPFGPPGVDCRTCLRAPCTCPIRLFFPACPPHLEPYPRVLDSRGRIKPHRFEEAHDDPAGSDTCWDCLEPRTSKVHRS